MAVVFTSKPQYNNAAALAHRNETPTVKRPAGARDATDSTHREDASQKRLAFAGMNPDLLADGRTNLRFDAFNEAHADPLKFISRADGGGNFQRGLFNFAPAKMWSCVDAFECVRHFSCFHNLLSWLRR
jgi:hypothetical protein